ncbi:hypothetical protein KQI38_12875 [Tissierella carlieri]|uniref:DUF6512 family protein n=1 Tax=Tissierella carlieri TaxID=689904 RepID=A0ABT1SG15_9FIRM|nr:DUF6512 family protein [Tissierella carlieri]MBU5312931.1 hypothetical protein [Tissierella carlieri]MCQ4925420.1 DUF6512 family protein [Tissierella carlieri]
MFNDYTKVKRWELWGILWIIIVGSLLHFTYEWSGKSSIVGVFSPVNESVWEHLKLGYFSLLVFSIIEYWFIKNKANNFFIAKAIGIISMEVFIVIAFYLYTWITKNPILFMDIGIFVLGAIICQLISLKIMKLRASKTVNNLGLIVFILIGCLFILFTFYTPELPIFMDPKTKKYGI